MLLRENVPFFYDISQDAAGIRFRKAFFHAVSNGKAADTTKKERHIGGG